MITTGKGNIGGQFAVRNIVHYILRESLSATITGLAEINEHRISIQKGVF